jgi:integrase
LLATLTFAGLRIGEALALRWRDLDLARGTITTRAGKTAAASRTINILPVLGAELRVYAAAAKHDQAGLVFGTSTGGAHHRSQIRSRVLAPAIKNANEQLAADGLEPLPIGLTLHSLRRTFASLLFAIGETPAYVMGQLGHTTAELTLSLYARQMDRRDGEPERIRALVEGRSPAEFRPSNGRGSLMSLADSRKAQSGRSVQPARRTVKAGRKVDRLRRSKSVPPWSG